VVLSAVVKFGPHCRLKLYLKVVSDFIGLAWCSSCNSYLWTSVYTFILAQCACL